MGGGGEEGGWSLTPSHCREGAGGGVAGSPGLALSLEPSLCSADSTPLSLPLPITNWETEVGRSPQKRWAGGFLQQGRACPLLASLGMGLPTPLRAGQALNQACGCTGRRCSEQRPHSAAPTGRESGPSRGHSLSLPEHRPASPAQGGSLGPFSPRLSPARAALPLGHQVAPSQGAQESLTGEGLSTCRPSRQHAPPPKVQVGLPPVWQESQLFEPLER